MRYVQTEYEVDVSRMDQRFDWGTEWRDELLAQVGVFRDAEVRLKLHFGWPCGVAWRGALGSMLDEGDRLAG